MSEYISILQEQIEEERKASHSAPHSASNSSRKIVQKKQLIPLEEPEKKETEVQFEENISLKTEEKNEEMNNTGGALWGNAEQIEEATASIQKGKQEQTQESKCLFDMIMEPPPKELKPTLFTYYDILMQDGAT